MIIITEIAEKLEKILNGVDSETNDINNPTDYYFQVETEGFHIDHIQKPDGSGNFIPVFVSSLGGQFNPVKGLKQGSYTYQISFYYPVRFKKDFYALGEFLVDVFVGSILNYGEVSGKAVSNISAPQFGEIDSLDFKQFQKWHDAKFTKPIEKMEEYMSMVVNLYLSSSAPGFIYGNDVKTSLSFTFDGHTYTLEDVDCDGASLQSNSQAQSEQEEDADVPETTSLPFGSTYAQSFKVYPNLNAEAKETTYVEQVTYIPDVVYYTKNGNTYTSVGKLTASQYNGYHGQGIALYIKVPIYFYKELLKVWFSGRIQEVECSFTYEIAGDSELKYTRECFIQSALLPIEKGQLLGITLTFAKKTQLEE